MTTKRAIINRLGQVVVVEMDRPELLSDLSTTRIAVRPDALYGIKATREIVPLTVSEPSEYTTAYPAGLEARISQRLLECGYSITPLNHYGPRKHLTLTESGHRGLDAAAQLVVEHDQGLIRVKRQKMIPGLIAAMARALPDATWAIVGGSQPAVRKVTSHLPLDLPFTQLDGRTQSGSGARIVFGSLNAMHDTQVEIWKRDVLLFLNATHVLHKRARGLLDLPDCHFRMFGFLPLSAQCSQSERDWLQAWFGSAEVVVLSKESLARPVLTTWFKTRAGRVRRLDSHIDGVAAKKLGVHQNSRRDQLVARRAEAFSKGDWRSLHLSLTAFARRFPADRPPRVAVLVDEPSHALRLAGRLPQWKVAPLSTRTACPEVLDGLGVQADRLLDDSDHDTACCILATETCTPDRLSGMDVLVRADGGCGIPACLPEFVIDSRISGPLLVADFRDHHHPDLQKLSKSREQAYAVRNWHRLEQGSVG